MRNLKRVLSLVMMVAMLSSMMIIGANAAYKDFTDEDEIVNKTAVNTLVELNVIAGKEDGSFYDPTGTLTRAEAAKLICVMLNGGKEPVLGDPDYVSYKDTKGTWGAKYIEYTTSLGIIAGDGQGYFKPNDPVTATALAKMVLVALGYDAKFEGLVGNNWASKTDALANRNSLYEGLAGVVTSDSANRDNAAQVLYNGLSANLVRYKSAGEGGGVGTVADPQVGRTVLTDFFNVDAVEAVVVANDVFFIAPATAKAQKDKAFFDVKTVNDQKPAAGDPTALPVDVDNDLVGQNVTLYVKNYGKTTASVLGSPIVSEQNTVVTTTKGFKNVTKLNDFLKENNITLNETAVALIDNGAVSSLETATAANILAESTPVPALANPGVELRLVDNDGDGVVDMVFRTAYTLAKVTGYNTTDEKVTIGTTSIDFDDVVGLDNIAKGDIVLFAKVGATTYYVEKAETVSGKVTAYDSADNKLTINGEAYAKSALANETTLNAFKVDPTDYLGNSYTFYLDQNGNIIATDVYEAGAKDYALVLNSGSDAGILGSKVGAVKLLQADGATKTYNVDLLASALKYGETGTDTEKKDNMATKLAVDALQNKIVTYTVNEDGTVTLAPTTADGTKAVDGIDAAVQPIKTNAAYTVGSDTIVAVNNDTLFFFVDGEDTSVVKGASNLPSKSSATVTDIAYDTNDGNHVATAVYVAGKTSSNAEFVYVTADPTITVVNGTTLYTYSVVSADGTVKTDVTTKTQVAKETLYKLTKEGNYYVLNAPAADETLADYVITQVTGNSLILKNSGNDADSLPITMTSDVKVLNVEGKTPVTGDRQDLAKDVRIQAILNDDGVVSQIFITDSVVEASDWYEITNSVVSTTPRTGAKALEGAPVTLTLGTPVTGEAKIYKVTKTDGGAEVTTFTIAVDGTTGTFTMPAYAVTIAAAV